MVIVYIGQTEGCMRVGCVTYGKTEEEARSKLWQICPDCFKFFCRLVEANRKPELSLGGFKN